MKENDFPRYLTRLLSQYLPGQKNVSPIRAPPTGTRSSYSLSTAKPAGGWLRRGLLWFDIRKNLCLDSLTGSRRSAIVRSLQGTIDWRSSIPSVGLARKSSQKTFIKLRKYWGFQIRKAKSRWYPI